ncbi:MAG: hypothetical protein COB98_09135 [Flavobacteriaceae bacterium]|nr:MAG: hypothetical protein COB98_09135 [Flavobacteriaceae bacterium]
MKSFLYIGFLLTFFITVGQNNTQLTVTNSNANTKNSDFGTSYFGDNQIIFASAKKRISLIDRVWNPNKQPFLDLFIADVASDGSFENITRFSKRVNSRYHEADVMFTKDGKKVYFTRSNYTNGHYGKDSLGINNLKMYSASVKQGEWKNIQELPFNSDAYSVGHPSLSDDGKTLYFVSDMPGTLGKTDIFKVAILEGDSYGTPENLGAMVNTAEKEMFPFVIGNELYFASEGHKDNLGGLDIYVTKIFPNFILEPAHLQAPINTEKDDFALILNADYSSGYFSSNRALGVGDDDIYHFTSKDPIRFICKQVLHAIVKDAESNEVLKEVEVQLLRDTEMLITRLNLDMEIRIENVIDCDKAYVLTAIKDGYQDGRIAFNTKGIYKKEVDVVIYLDKIIIEAPLVININPIYFDFDKHNIRPDAALELDKVVAVMKENPSIIVESGSHTDARGKDQYNIELSARRAAETVAYIISKGIAPERISSKGYGETQLTNKCTNGIPCSVEEHQSNRRTEFVIRN